MRTFDDNETWGGKVNFVDKNNVLVGFDTHQCCCEDFGWYYMTSDKVRIGNDPDQETLEPYYFDETFIEYPDDEWSDNGDVMFKLIKEENDESPLYLRLYNHHNGYYSHGFEMSKDKTIVHEGSL